MRLGRSRRTGLQPTAWVRIVKSCAALDPLDKLIWEEHWYLDRNPRLGAYISASALASRLGVARVTVERARKTLQEWGLLLKKDRGEGRTASWFVTLPAGCHPGSRRLDEDLMAELGERLAEHARRLSTSLSKSEVR